MNVRFEAKNPNKIEFTATITLTLEEWMQLRSHLPEGYPWFKIAGAISSAVLDASKVFRPDEVSTD